MITLPISVVIPAYNAAKYIEMTIASVRAQSMGVDEIIVVDDGSTDDTVILARRSGAYVCEQANRGVSVARNSGASRARNEWIALLDADDLWQPDKIERQWLALQAAEAASFAFSDFSQFDELRVRNQSVLHEIHKQFNEVKLTPLGGDAFVCDKATLGAALLVQNVIQPSALLIRRQTLLGLKGFDEKLLACQDYDFVIRLTRDNVGVYVDKPLVRYRRHATATTSNVPKSREGLANVALRALTHSWEYPPEAVAHFRSTLPSLFIKCGFAHLRYGSPGRARKWLRRSISERFTIVGILLYALTFAVETQAGRDVRSMLLRTSAMLRRAY